MKHQGTEGAGTLLDVDGEGIRQCPMGASCLWQPVSSVTSSSGPPTPFYILIIGVWGSFVPEDGSVGSTPNLLGHMGPLFKL
jgi:hypothetical protein